MVDLFTRHPRTMNETYFQHLGSAGLFGIKMLIGSLVCLIHAVFPFLFQKAGSNILFSMVHDYVNRAPSTEARVTCLAKVLGEKTLKSAAKGE